jgi:predicted acylesterase/phospholipase RssA
MRLFPQNPFTTIVLSGGSIKGFGMLGILDSLLVNDVFSLEMIENFIGSSVGAMICMFLAIGLTPLAITLINIRIMPISLFRNKGNLINELRKCFDSVKIDPDVTFEEFHKITGKNLVITSYDTKNNLEHYYNYKDYPTTKIFTAIEQTVAIPLFMESDNNIDGCFCSPFPISFAKRNKYGPILGIYAMSSPPLKFNHVPILSIYDDLKTIIMKFMTQVSTLEADKADNSDYIIPFKYDGLPFETFTITYEAAEFLFFLGKKVIKEKIE